MSKPTAPLGARTGRAAVCSACGGDIRSPATLLAASDPVCESAHCRALMARRGTISADAFRFQVEMLRRQRREQLERTAARQQRLAERHASEALEHASLRAAISGEERHSTASYPLVVLPSGPQGLEALPADRRERYREHLATLVAAAVAAGADDASDAPPQTASAEESIPLAAQFCALCRGGCCSMGGDQAYLTAVTIRRFMRRRPDLRPDEVASAYLDRLEGHTISRSCIHHGAAGCSLPREMRADTCNQYYCTPVREWHAGRASGARPLGAFVIQRRADNWCRESPEIANDVVGVSVVEESGTRQLRTLP